MTAKDQKIIDAHTGAAPYDLLMEHGLSQKGYNELLAREDAKVSNMLQAGHKKQRQEPVQVNPVVTTLTLKSTTMLRNKKTGELTPMNTAQATKMAGKYPKDFELE